MEGKKEFYQKVRKALESAGYQYFDEKEIPGKGRSHASKPDYIAAKGDIVVIGEIKSPAEPPASASWRKIQNSDGDNFKKVRLEVANREAANRVSKEIGGHEIIIRGQIPDYLEKLGRTYDFPLSINAFKKMLTGYSFPSNQNNNVEEILRRLKKNIFEKIDIGKESATIIFY